MTLKDKKILIGITGSIAAYKTILLIRLLIKEGAEVKIIMTPAAKDFVTPLTLSTLSKNKVYTEWSEDDIWSNHVDLGRWADVFIIAPASCNTIAKMANGICDNLLLSVYLSATCKVVVAPAMDEDMWHHNSTKRNLQQLKKDGVFVLTVDKGELASGLFGDGRMQEPEEILIYLKENFFRKNLLKGKKVLITAGPTYEAIDPVRFIGNHSSGKMGFALAEAFYENGAEAVLISGPTHQQLSYKGIQLISVTSSNNMYKACLKYFSSANIVVMSAAVADYKPVNVSSSKIKKQEKIFNIELEQTKDILATMGKQKKTDQFIAGFALETETGEANAIQKLQTKNLDCIILNSLTDKKAGFGYDTNKITIIDSKQKQTFSLKTKKEVADDIVAYIMQRLN